MISAPPFELGADQVTSRVPLLGVSVSSVGLVGVVRGVADNELESSEFPKLLVATMVTVYSTPLVSPVTVMGPLVPATCWPPLDGDVRSAEVTV